MSSILITGTSKGIGFETALAFARAGHKVYATMRNPSQSPQLAQVVAREKLPITISTMDVDSDSSVSQRIVQIQKDHGPIDVLVNNAGVERAGSIEEIPLADFRAVMETNYFGAIRCIQAVVPHMEFLVQPAHGTVLSRDHRQSVPVLGLRRAAGEWQRGDSQPKRLW